MDLVAERHMAHRFCEHDLRAPPLRGIMNSDQLPGLVYASDMVKHYGSACPITDANPTGSRVSPQGLVLSFDGKTLKNHAGGADGVASGGVVLGGATGPRGPATQGDGVDDYISYSGIPSAAQGCVALLMYVDGVSTTNRAYNQNSKPMIYTNGSILKATFAGATGMPGGAYTGSITVSTGWHMVMFAWNATTYWFYVDGSLAETVSGCVIPASGSFVELFRWSGSYSTNPINAAYLWNRLPTQTEVRQLFEDSQGWVSNIANPHCKDIDTAHPLGSDRDVLLGWANTPISDANPTGSRVSSDGLVLSFDGSSLRNHAGGADGVASGGVVLGGVAGPRGMVTAFDGVDDYVTFAGLPSQSKGSVRVVFTKTREQTSDFAINIGNAIKICCFAASNIVTYFNGATGMPQTSGTKTIDVQNVPVGIHEAIFAWEGDTYWFFVDGRVADTRSGCTFPPISGLSYLNYSAGNYGAHTIHEAQVWNRRLTQAEMRQLHEDFWGYWSSHDSNVHCLDISDEHPLGTDRVSDDGLVLSLDMETLTATGRLKDFSGRGNDMVITNGSPKYQANGIKNGCYLFANTDSIRTTSVIPASSDVTYAAWVKFTGTPADYCIIIGKNSSGNFEKVQIMGGSKKPYLKLNANDAVTANTAVPADTWVHIAFVVQGSNIYCYRNGQPDGSAALSRAAVSGQMVIADGSIFAGAVSQPFYAARALSASEIATLYTDSQKASGLGQGCVLALDMETTNPNGTLRDMSGQGAHLTSMGSPKYARSGIKNGSYSFNGSTDSFMGADGSAGRVGTDLTIIMAINAAALSSDADILAKTTTNLGYRFRLLASGALRLSIYNGTAGVGFNGTVGKITAGQTNIVAVTLHAVDASNSMARIYVNGALDLSNTQAFILADAPSNPVEVGAQRAGATFFNGKIGPVAVWSRALSDDEISKLTLDMQKMLGLCQGNPGNAPAPVGSAVDLNGTSQYIEIADCPALALSAAMTLGAWILPEGPESYANVLSKWGTNVGIAAYALRCQSNGSISLSECNGTSTTGTSAAITQNAWQLAIGTLSGANNAIYMNGVLKSSITTAVTPQVYANSLRIGCIPGALQTMFTGRIAYPFIANQAWPASLIQWLMRMQLNARW